MPYVAWVEKSAPGRGLDSRTALASWTSAAGEGDGAAWVMAPRAMVRSMASCILEMIGTGFEIEM